jgi:hypothetical protein
LYRAFNFVAFAGDAERQTGEYPLHPAGRTVPLQDFQLTVTASRLRRIKAVAGDV